MKTWEEDMTTDSVKQKANFMPQDKMELQQIKCKTHTYIRYCSLGRKQDCTIPLPKVGLYHTSSPSRTVPYLVPKQGCSISPPTVEMYHISSQSRTVPYSSQSRTVPHHFPKQVYTTPLPKVGRYHTSSKTRTLSQFLFNVCPLAHQCLLGSLPCACICLHTSF